MIWFIQMNLLNIDRPLSCQWEYTDHTDHTLRQYLQLRGCQMIVLSDSPRCFEPFCSTYQSCAGSYLITLFPVCKHPTRKFVLSFPKFYFQFQVSSRKQLQQSFFCNCSRVQGLMVIAQYSVEPQTQGRTSTDIRQLTRARAVDARFGMHFHSERGNESLFKLSSLCVHSP